MNGNHNPSRLRLLNVLEEQVLKEAERQVNQLPPIDQQRVHVIEVAAYVLNRMPPMYATNRAGWGFQREKALRLVSREVNAQVSRAIEALKRSPSRPQSPLPQALQAESSLVQIQALLGRDDLDWLTLPQIVADLLARARGRN